MTDAPAAITMGDEPEENETELIAEDSPELTELREIRRALTILVSQVTDLVQLANKLGAEADKLFGGMGDPDGKPVNPLTMMMKILSPKQ